MPSPGAQTLFLLMTFAALGHAHAQESASLLRLHESGAVLVERPNGELREVDNLMPLHDELPPPSNEPPGRLKILDLRSGEIETIEGVAPSEFLAQHEFPAVGELFEAAKNYGDFEHIPDPTIGNYPRHVKLTTRYFDEFGMARTGACSGTLIGPRHVITAGHCIYIHETIDNMQNRIPVNDFVNSITVHPGYNDGSSPRHGTADVVSTLWWSGWVEDENYSGDVAVLKLSRPVGAITGWQGYGWSSDCDFYKQSGWGFYVYPGAAHFGLPSPYDGSEMYRKTGSYDECSGREVRYDRMNYRGTSGGGALKNGAVWAIVSHGSRDDTSDVKISEQQFNDIAGWIDGSRPSAVDLEPLDMQCSQAGQRVASGHYLDGLSFRVLNDSRTPFQGTVSYALHLSVDGTIDANDILLRTGSKAVSLGAPGFDGISIPPTQIPSSVVDGTYFLGVRILNSDASAVNNVAGPQDVKWLSVACPEAGIPEKVYPNDDMNCINRNEANFSWRSVVGGGGYYQLQVSQTCLTGFSPGGIHDPFPVAGTYTTTAKSYTLDDLLPQTRYHWRVRAESPCGGWGPWSNCWDFRTNGPGAAPEGMLPVPNTSCLSTSPTLSWDDEDVYMWEIELRDQLTQPGEIRYVPHGNGPQIVWEGLEPGKSYWWRVRSMSWCASASAWCTVRRFSTEPVLSPTTLAKPEEGSSCASPNPEVVVMSTGYGSTYEIEWGRDCSFGSSAMSSSTHFTIPDALERGQTYTWRARGVHPCGQVAAWSECRSFTVDDTPPANPPSMAALAHTVGEWSSDNAVRVAWDPVEDACADILNRMEYSFAWDTSPETTADDTPEWIVTASEPVELEDGDAHWFHMRAVDPSGLAAPETMHLGPFLIDTTPPALPTLTHADVLPDAVGNYDVVELRWEADDAMSGIIGYRVQMGGGSDGDAIPDPLSLIGENRVELPIGRLGPGSYDLTIRAVDAAGNFGEPLAFGPIVHVSPYGFDAPARGELLSPNDAFEITWGIGFEHAGKANLEVTYDGGASWELVATLASPQLSLGRHEWIVPDRDSDQAAFRLQGRGLQRWSLTSYVFAIDGIPEDDWRGPLSRRPELHPAAPNPFNPQTTVSFDLPRPAAVQLSVYDVQGRRVRTLVDEERPAGRHEIVWDGIAEGGRSVASGVYLLRLDAAGATQTRRVVLVK